MIRVIRADKQPAIKEEKKEDKKIFENEKKITRKGRKKKGATENE